MITFWVPKHFLSALFDKNLLNQWFGAKMEGLHQIHVRNVLYSTALKMGQSLKNCENAKFTI